MRLLAIYDNEGKTLDRYTFITDITDYSGRYHDMLGTDEHGVGYSRWGTVVKDPDFFNFDNREWRTRCKLGKRQHFENLSAELQSHVARRLWGNE